jgi:hypothetical protein
VCIGRVALVGDTRFEAPATHGPALPEPLPPRPKGTEPPRTDIDNVIAAILNSGGPR